MLGPVGGACNLKEAGQRMWRRVWTVREEVRRMAMQTPDKDQSRQGEWQTQT